jgi:DNA mismatch repair ATPase MutS
MPKINYLRALIESIKTDELQSVVEEYAKLDKNFEAFLIGKTGKAVDTGKTYAEYREELEKILKKCTTRKGFVKVTRVNNAGIESFRKLLQSHFKNENFGTALWMSLALMETSHQMILMNTRYRSFKKPFKSFEKALTECRDLLDTSYKFAKPTRKDRQEIFKALVRCWWGEREKTYELQYFKAEDLFQYAERDEDFLSLQLSLHELKPRAKELDKKYLKNSSAWQRVWSGYFVEQPEARAPGSLLKTLEDMENLVKKSLEKWE